MKKSDLAILQGGGIITNFTNKCQVIKRLMGGG
jgi:hypothetical protein